MVGDTVANQWVARDQEGSNLVCRSNSADHRGQVGRGQLTMAMAASIRIQLVAKVTSIGITQFSGEPRRQVIMGAPVISDNPNRMGMLVRIPGMQMETER